MIGGSRTTGAKPITRPKPKKPPVTLQPHQDPTHPDYISPAEERRLRRELFRRVEYLFEVAAIKGYGPVPPRTDRKGKPRACD